MAFLGKATQTRFLEWQWMKWTSWSPAVWMILCAIPTLAREITGQLKCCLLLWYYCFTARLLLILYGKYKCWSLFRFYVTIETVEFITDPTLCFFADSEKCIPGFSICFIPSMGQMEACLVLGDRVRGCRKGVCFVTHKCPGIVEVNVVRRNGTQLFLHGNQNLKNPVNLVSVKN